MSPLQFWLNPPVKCPKCGKDTVRLSYIEADNGTATLNYACDKCGMVKAAVISLKPPERK
jgi:transcription elongation factor Elf1